MWNLSTAHFDHTLIETFDTTTLREFCFWMNPVSCIFHNCYFFIPRLIMCWNFSQKKLFSPPKLFSFPDRLITWDSVNVNSRCWIINWLHHPQPIYPTECKEPYMQWCISWTFNIIMSRPTGRTCFFMAWAYCTKYFSASYTSTGVGPGLFYANFPLLFLHFLSKVWYIMPYPWTAFACDISPVSIFLMASSMSL